MLKAILNRPRTIGRVAFAAFLAITFCMAHPASEAQAKKRKPAKYGTIKILSTPGGLPLEINGRSEGQTTTDYRSFDLNPGLHTIVINLPNGQRWTRQVDLRAGRIKCVDLNFKQLPPVEVSPCPYPVNLSVNATEVTDGAIITFRSTTDYSGDTSALNYTWDVSPSNTTFQRQGNQAITVDSTGLAGQRITATLVVDDGSGDPNCRVSEQASTMVRPPPPQESPSRQFDVCCSCSFDDQKARLDNLGVELQNDPSLTTYIIAYGGRRSRSGQANLLGARARDYLVTNRAIDQSRIIVLDGGFRE